MKTRRTKSLREQWQELFSQWQREPNLPSPLRRELEKHGVRFLIPVGVLAGRDMQRPAAPPVFCDVVDCRNRPCMLICAGEPEKTSRLDAVALKKILRGQKIALSGALPIAYFWFGRCELAPDDAETFPDFDAAGALIQKAAEANTAGVSQFVYTEKMEGVGALLAQALSRRRLPETASVPPPYADFLGWLEKRRPLPPQPEPSVDSDPADFMPLGPLEEYDTFKIIDALTDHGSFLEYRSEYGRTLICGYAQIGKLPVGIVANRKKHVREGGRPFEFGGVIYSESADKAARFILDCNQNGLPILFLQDVNGFMVGREAEISGIIRSGAKMVNAVANSVVPKITLILGGSYGAGNYAMCGKAYDPLFILGWPTARYAVMGGDQAARTLCELQIRQAESSGKKLSERERNERFDTTKKTYDAQLDPRYAAARLWIDHIPFPGESRLLLFHALKIAHYAPKRKPLRTGVIQT